MARNFKPKQTNNSEGVIPVKKADDSLENGEDLNEITPLVEEQEDKEIEITSSEEKKEEIKAPEIIFDDTESKAPVEKNVKVCLKIDHSCVIGGQRYNFTKGKQYNVPAGVKDILRRADLLMPL